jgi:16S rRNA processing protein RimM
MYQSPKYIAIGQILKPTGTKGEVKVDVYDEFWEDMELSPHIFLNMGGSYVPFFIEYIKETHQNTILKIEEVDAPEVAIAYNLKDIYLRENEIQSPEYFDSMLKNGWEGFTIYNGTQYIGTITEIQSHPQQWIALVEWNGREVLIPLADDWIVEVDEDDSKLVMNLPEGLLDINA